MGCGCNKQSQALQNYVYTSPSGQSKTYRSEIEARAAQIRNGGGTYVAVNR